MGPIIKQKARRGVPFVIENIRLAALPYNKLANRSARVLRPQLNHPLLDGVMRALFLEGKKEPGPGSGGIR
jgi:hypothetical protein